MSTKLFLGVMVCALIFASFSFGLSIQQVDPSGVKVSGSGTLSDSSGTAGPVNRLVTDPNDAYFYVNGYQDFHTPGYITKCDFDSSMHFGGGEAWDDSSSFFADFMASTGISYDSTDLSSQGQVWAEAETINDGITHGCYMQIVPSQPGEQIGDLVYIEMGLIITTTITADNGQVIISGSNGMDHLAITLNQPTPTWPGNPDPIREICTVPAQTITTTIEFGEMVYPVSVQAHIGDVIGVYGYLKSSLNETGNGYYQAYGSINLHINGRLDTNDMDFNNDGYVDLIDFATFANEWMWVRGGRLF